MIVVLLPHGFSPDTVCFSSKYIATRTDISAGCRAFCIAIKTRIIVMVTNKNFSRSVTNRNSAKNQKFDRSINIAIKYSLSAFRRISSTPTSKAFQ